MIIVLIIRINIIYYFHFTWVDRWEFFVLEGQQGEVVL